MLYALHCPIKHLIQQDKADQWSNSHKDIKPAGPGEHGKPPFKDADLASDQSNRWQNHCPKYDQDYKTIWQEETPEGGVRMFIQFITWDNLLVWCQQCEKRAHLHLLTKGLYSIIGKNRSNTWIFTTKITNVSKEAGKCPAVPEGWWVGIKITGEKGLWRFPFPLCGGLCS